MPRKRDIEIKSWHAVPPPEVCPLCGRAIPPDQRDLHHFIPKSRGGRETVPLHRICHRQIHALFSEAELEQSYSTTKQLLTDPAIRKFVAWVRKKPPGYYDGTRRSRRRLG
ncbi:HNH endonuclease [Rhizobium halophytocola]|uniref:HNH endonuclease n=1 Tax=Rhizobium halophytocola TaxID=735519 RepID=A0ABS4E3L0_9HYPH|nr:HNH endonuclease signature motif containing protein [Rhizobium halophytocola]MBP1852528.1 hypothetical protein [Rhizobium halophytocola]